MRARFTRTRTRPLASRSVPEHGPERVGRYLIRRRLGMGGMGVVYEAFDERVERLVALKLMLVGDADVDRERLRREAQALARLSHPNVVEVFEIGEHHDPGSGEPPRAYVAMELVDGPPLDRWLRLRRRSPAEIVQVFVQAGEGLAAAHAHGLVHRDFKPGNVLVGSDGRVRVVDFGLVRESDTVEPSASAADGPRPFEHSAEHSAERSAEALPQANWSESLTKTGAMVGTPAYMSPEQLTHLPVGSQSDQFSFCVALYEALFRQHPFVVDGQWSALPLNVLDGAVVPPPAEPRVPARLVKVILRGLAVRPEHRWPSMDELLPELRRALERRSPRPVLAALAVGAAVIGLALASPTEANVVDRCEEASDVMGEAWGPRARDAIREAWLGTGRSSDADTWSRVDARMQVYADDWWAVHRTACSGSVRSPSSATCLARLAEGVRTRLQVMATPNDSLLDNAVQMIGELPSVDRCRAALDDPPDTEPKGMEDAPWRGDLDRVSALMKAGQYEEARPLLEELLERAALEGNTRMMAELRIRAGYLHEHDGDVEGAADAFEQAYLDAKLVGRDAVAAEASIALLQLFGEHYYREAEATRWARHARAEAERIDDPHLTSRVYNAWGRALRGGGELEQALSLHQQALELQRSLPSIEDGELALSHFQIGSCLGLLGRGDEARPHLQEALRLQEAAYGSRHPRVATTLINMGVFLSFEGKAKEALASYERAFGILQEWSPHNPATSWVVLLNISSIHKEQGRPLQAAEALRRWLEIVERAPTPESIEPVRVEWIRGQIFLYEGKPEDALPHFERAAGMEASIATDAHMAIGGLAMSLHELGRLEEAVAAHRRALELLEPKPGAAPEIIAINTQVGTRRTLARVLSELGDHQAALQELQRASALHAEHLDDGPPMAEIDVEIGAELTRLERGAEALPLLREAVRTIEAQDLDPGKSWLVSALVALAEAELARGDRAALEHAERAVRLAEAAPGDPSKHAPKARFVLARCLGSAREERARALALARQAEEQLASEGPRSARALEEVRAWLGAQR